MDRITQRDIDEYEEAYRKTFSGKLEELNHAFRNVWEEIKKVFKI